jgi:hypothetical protein
VIDQGAANAEALRIAPAREWRARAESAESEVQRLRAAHEAVAVEWRDAESRLLGLEAAEAQIERLRAEIETWKKNYDALDREQSQCCKDNAAEVQRLRSEIDSLGELLKREFSTTDTAPLANKVKRLLDDLRVHAYRGDAAEDEVDRLRAELDAFEWSLRDLCRQYRLVFDKVLKRGRDASAAKSADAQETRETVQMGSLWVNNVTGDRWRVFAGETRSDGVWVSVELLRRYGGPDCAEKVDATMKLSEFRNNHVELVARPELAGAQFNCRECGGEKMSPGMVNGSKCLSLIHCSGCVHHIPGSVEPREDCPIHGWMYGKSIRDLMRTVPPVEVDPAFCAEVNASIATERAAEHDPLGEREDPPVPEKAYDPTQPAPWEIALEIGLSIPEEAWAKVPRDLSMRGNVDHRDVKPENALGHIQLQPKPERMGRDAPRDDQTRGGSSGRI